MRKVVLSVVVGLVLVGAFSGTAAADTRCCKKQNPPPTSSPPPLPATGLPLFVPMLVSLGLIGTGVVLRRRARESF